MSLRIGFDLDGVVADMDSALKRHEQRLFVAEPREPSSSKPAPNPQEPGEASENDDATDSVSVQMKEHGLSPSQRRRLWQEVESIENFWETLDEIEPGAVQAIADHTASRRWEVIFLTKRPSTDGLTSQRQSQRWLQRHGFPMPSVFVVQGSRGSIADALALDVVIDDLPANCVDIISDSDARAILVCRDHSKSTLANATRLGIATVPTVAACLQMLVELDGHPLRGRRESSRGPRRRRPQTPSTPHPTSGRIATMTRTMRGVAAFVRAVFQGLVKENR
jgi:hypothetical protein